MKKTLAVLFATVVFSSATVVNVNSGSGSGRTDIVDNSGASLGGGFAFLGSWSGDLNPVAPLTNDELRAGFAVIASSESALQPATSGPPSWPDINNSIAINNVPKTDVPAGSFIDVLVMDTNDISTATQALIYRLSAVYDATSVATPQGLDYTTDAGVEIYGSKFQTAQVGVIPEPSSALLAGLALVGGLVRRRR